MCGLAFNVVFDPLVGYFLQNVHPGTAGNGERCWQRKWSTATTFVNAVVSVILVGAAVSCTAAAAGRQGMLVKTR